MEIQKCVTDQPTSDIDPKSPTGDQCGSGELVEKKKKEVQFEKYISHISREWLNGGSIRELHFSNLGEEIAEKRVFLD